MALRDGYALVPDAQGAIRDGYVLSPDANGALREGYDNILSTGPSALSLADPRGDYTGRVGQAVPAGAAPLPTPKGGVPPYTYTVEDLPAGVTQTDGVLAGNPTTARHGAAAEVTITATDSADTPATVTKTFDFSILAASNAMTLEDFRFRGYHAYEWTGLVYAMVVRSGITVGTSTISRNIWSARSGQIVGSRHTDAEEDLTLDVAPRDTILDRIRYNGGEQFVINHNNTREDGTSAILSLTAWAAAGGAGHGKVAYVGKVDGTFIDLPIADLDGSGGPWARWVVDGSDETYIEAITSGSDFAFVIAD